MGKRRCIVVAQVAALSLSAFFVLSVHSRLALFTAPGTSRAPVAHGHNPPPIFTIVPTQRRPTISPAGPATGPPGSEAQRSASIGQEKVKPGTFKGQQGADTAQTEIGVQISPDELEGERAGPPALEHEDSQGRTEVETTKGIPAQEPLNAKSRFSKAASLIPSILDPSDTSVDRLSCPRINATRYGYLRKGGGGDDDNRTPRPTATPKQYFFALNLRQCVNLLPRLLGSVVEAIRFLGPERCALSIVEGNSDDGTLEVLRLLVGELAALGVEYWLASSTLDPSRSLRIRKLARLRAMAVEPITGSAEILRGQRQRQRPWQWQPGDEERGVGGDGDGDDGHGYDDHNHHNDLGDETGTTTYFSKPDIPLLPLTQDATIIFLNDVSACTEDILELAHQLVFQRADMVCAMDWTNPLPRPPSSSSSTTPTPSPPPSPSPSPGTPIFYDVWIARSMTGNLFFDIPASTGGWDRSADLFFDHPASRARFAAGVPTQVFSCWNGGVALRAAPLVPAPAAAAAARGKNGDQHETKPQVRFRWSRPGECFQGEPQLLCKDLWRAGRGRIAVVPAVNLEYSDRAGRWVKEQRGYVSDFVQGAAAGRRGSAATMTMMDAVGERIEWDDQPPDMVKCAPTFTQQWWLPWNESSV